MSLLVAKAILFGSWVLVTGLLVAVAFRDGIYWVAGTIFLIGLVLWAQEKLLSRLISYPTPNDIYQRHPLARPSIFAYVVLVLAAILYHAFIGPLAIFAEPTALFLVLMVLGAGLAPTLLVQYYAFKALSRSDHSHPSDESGEMP